MIFMNACSGVLTIFLVASVGFILRRTGLVGDETVRILPRLITVVILPPFLFRNVMTTFDREQLLVLLSGAIVPFIYICLSFCLGALIASVFRVRTGRRGIFSVAFCTSNNVNIGLPVTIALFGEGAVAYVMIFFLGSVTLFWSVGNYVLAHDGESKSVRLFSMTTLKQILSPPLLGFLCGMLLVLLDVHLPVFIDKAFKYVGDMAIAMALFYIGIMLADTRLKEFKAEKDVTLVLLGRFLISPLIMLGVSSFFSLPDTMRHVFIMLTSLPVMVNLAILAGYHKADARYATILTSVSTLMALVTVPIWALIIGYL